MLERKINQLLTFTDTMSTRIDAFRHALINQRQHVGNKPDVEIMADVKKAFNEFTRNKDGFDQVEDFKEGDFFKLDPGSILIKSDVDGEDAKEPEDEEPQQYETVIGPYMESGSGNQKETLAVLRKEVKDLSKEKLEAVNGFINGLGFTLAPDQPEPKLPEKKQFVIDMVQFRLDDGKLPLEEVEAYIGSEHPDNVVETTTTQPTN